MQGQKLLPGNAGGERASGQAPGETAGIFALLEGYIHLPFSYLPEKVSRGFRVIR